MAAELHAVSDAELWARATAGDADAFTDLYTRHVDRVGRFLARRVGAQDAQDLTSQVFLEAWRQRDRVYMHVHAGLLPWLLGVALNLSRGHVRNLARQRRLDARLGLAEAEPDPSVEIVDAAEARDQLRIARMALDAMSDPDKEVLTLCLVEGLTPGGAAVALGQRPSTVRSRLTRARRRLAATYNDLLPTDLESRR